MRILNIFHELLYDSDKLIITVDRKNRLELESKLEALGSIDTDAEYDVKIEKHRKHRSRDANSYMWVLADKIADATHTSKDDVYRKAIREAGVFTDLIASTKATEAIIRSWSDKGIGWFADSFSSSVDGCKRVRLYYGSSTYNSKEMSRLIDSLVDEAKGLHIETMTPDELARIKATWRGDVA